MALILDGNSDLDAPVWSEIGNLICVGNLSINLKKKTLKKTVSLTRTLRVLRYHLRYVIMQNICKIGN